MANSDTHNYLKGLLECTKKGLLNWTKTTGQWVCKYQSTQVIVTNDSVIIGTGGERQSLKPHIERASRVFNLLVQHLETSAPEKPSVLSQAQEQLDNL